MLRVAGAQKPPDHTQASKGEGRPVESCRGCCMEKSGSYLESRADEWVWRAGLEKDEEL